MANEKDTKWNGEDICKSSENYISVKRGCLKLLDPYRVLDFSLKNRNIKLFPISTCKKMEDKLFTENFSLGLCEK